MEYRGKFAFSSMMNDENLLTNGELMMRAMTVGAEETVVNESLTTLS